MKLESGMQVRIVPTPLDDWSKSGEMDEWCNRIVTIDCFSDRGTEDDFWNIKEDQGKFCWCKRDFLPLSNLDITEYLQKKEKEKIKGIKKYV